MQPKTTLLFLFFLFAAIAPAQQILPPEVRPARPVEEPGNPAPPPATPPVEPVQPPDTPATPPVAPVAPPEAPAPREESSTLPVAPASPEKRPQPATATGSGDSEEVVPAAAMNAAALLPIGVPSFDVRMPEFSEDLLISRMRVRELTRIDEQQLDLRDMDLERYLPDGSLDYVINVERGFYELSTGRLISSAPTRLRGKSIDLHGQGCVYSRGNEVIKILGKVTSYIYVEKGQLTKPTTPAPAGENPPPAAPPAAPANP